MFSCDFFEPFQNRFFAENLRIAAFVFLKDYADIILIFISKNVIYDFCSRFCIMKIKWFQQRKLLVIDKVSLFFSSCFFRHQLYHFFRPKDIWKQLLWKIFDKTSLIWQCKEAVFLLQSSDNNLVKRSQFPY